MSGDRITQNPQLTALVPPLANGCSFSAGEQLQHAQCCRHRSKLVRRVSVSFAITLLFVIISSTFVSARSVPHYVGIAETTKLMSNVRQRGGEILDYGEIEAFPVGPSSLVAEWFMSFSRNFQYRKSTSDVSKRVERKLNGPGSSPPSCKSKCDKCLPCKPVHVPIQPGKNMPLEYYPEAWRCKCGNKLYMP
eukprot:Gb_33041 [translate_table: standard]